MQFRGDRPVIGILGGGQLAAMLSRAGTPLGVKFIQLAPEHGAHDDCVETVHAEFDDHAALDELGRRADVITYESENVPVETVEHLAKLTAVHPSRAALATAGDRFAEKELFQRLGIPTAPFARIESAGEIDSAHRAVGLPAVLKSRRMGYDGRGQAVCRTPEDMHSAWFELGEVPLLCEQWVGFDREVSIVGARAQDGDVRFWDVGENVHLRGQLHTSVVPAPDWTPALQERACGYLRSIMQELDYIGVAALELFQRGDELLANEMAPRVHNTGHWSIDGAATSQFENHVRAILGWPLGEPTRRGVSAMLNLVGEVPDTTELLAVPHAHVHIYGKEPRPRRKLGHVTVVTTSHTEATALLHDLEAIAPPR